jgi:hypothetical protein
MKTDGEVWLYGSTARGDDDADSDVDLLVVGRETSWRDVELPPNRRISASRYDWDEIEQMASYGSLFLHHLKSEGRALAESPQRRLRHILDNLGEYARADQELNSFRRVLDDVEESASQDHSDAFELSVVATSARHAAILGCYLLGKPNFGRDSAFEYLMPRLDEPPGSAEDFIWLYRFRRAEDEGEELPENLSSEELLEWVNRVRTLIQQVADLDK